MTLELYRDLHMTFVGAIPLHRGIENLSNFAYFKATARILMDSHPGKIVLVVESAALVLNTVRTILEKAHFRVLAAATAREAMRLADCTKKIDLLLSDVMLSDMSGPDFALKLRELRPETRVIMMSGYPNGAMLVLNYGWDFIEKPFVAAQLVARVNEVLFEEIRDQGTNHFDTRT